MKRLPSVLLVSASLALLLGLCELVPASPAPTARPIDFDRQIRPILADTCFKCHGPDEKQRMANLRLDETEGLFVDRGGYKIIFPGNSAQSKLYLKISSKDDSFRMPPVWSGRTLDEKQVELITGHGSRPSAPQCRRYRTRLGRAIPSITSSWRGWRAKT